MTKIIWHRVVSSIFYRTPRTTLLRKANIYLETGYGTEYSWENDGSEYVVYYTNVPIWYNIQKLVSVSTFTDWEKVVNLIQPLYEIGESDLNPPVTLKPEQDSKEEMML